MSEALSIPKNLATALPGIRLDATLEDVSRAIAEDWQQVKRCTIRLAVNAALSKRIHFDGQLERWYEWYRQQTGVARRTAILHDNAGQVLVRYLVEHGELQQLPLDYLEKLKPLTSERQVGLALSHRTEWSTVQDVASTVRHLLGLPDPEKPEPNGAHPTLPGLEILSHYNAALLEPTTELQFTSVRLQRSLAAIEARRDAMTPAQRAAALQWFRKELPGEVSRIVKALEG